MVNKSGAARAVKLLGKDHGGLRIRLAVEADKFEHQWLGKARELNHKISKKIIEALKDHGQATFPDADLYEFLFAHWREATKNAIRSTDIEMEVVTMRKVRLGPMRVPRSLKKIREAYDRWKRTGIVPKVFKKKAKDVKAEYLKKTQEVWRKYAEDYRAGKEADQANVLRKVSEAADTASNRVETIVRTETTNYYNTARREIYDQSEAVTHYLFLAIRDQRTTRWCSDRVVDGLRGRHGLVYIKGDPLTDEETPACHWNCRSEMVPLSPFNPRHLKLIEDYTMHRRNNRCYPLPKGWAA